MSQRMHALLPAVLAVALAAGSPASAGGPSAIADLDIVTVVGKRPQPLAEVAAAASIVTAADFEADIAFDLADALRHEPGVSFARDPHRFGTTGPAVRGLGGNRVLVETDGVPAARAFAVGSFSNTGRQFPDLEVVERIELLRGPASALYGSDAIAGVIAVATRNPAELLDGRDLALRSRAGYSSDDDSLMTAFTAAARTGPFESLLAFAHRDGSEFEHAGGDPPANPRDSDKDELLARTVFGPAAAPLRLTAGWHRQHDLTAVDSLELSGGRFANTILLQGDDEASGWRVLIDQSFGDAAVRGVATWRAYWQESVVDQRTHEERRAVPPAVPPLGIDREFRYRERTAGGEFIWARDVAAARGPHGLVAGLEIAEMRISERRNGLQTDLQTGTSTSTILGESLPVRDFPVSRIREIGVYLQDDWRPGAGSWSVIPALRADWYRLDPLPDPLYAEDNPVSPPVDIDEDSVSPKLGLAWRPRDGVSLYLQYAHGFRSPPFDDVNIGLDLPQFNVRAIPNPELKPERSDSLELGLRFGGGAATGSAAVFGSRYRDFIESRVNVGTDPDTGTTLFQSRNVARAEIHGAELAVDFALGAWRDSLAGWGGRIAFGWTEGDDTVRDRPLNGIDPPRGLVGLRWDSPSGKFGAGFDLTIVAAKHRVDESAGPLFQPDGYQVADLRLHWRPSRRISVDLGVFNLGDESYTEWATVRGRRPDDPLLPLYREPGRNAALTVGAVFD